MNLLNESNSNENIIILDVATILAQKRLQNRLAVMKYKQEHPEKYKEITNRANNKYYAKPENKDKILNKLNNKYINDEDFINNTLKKSD